MPTGWISSLIGGSFDILGGGLNALYSADAASKAYKRQVKIMKMQQNWQERMSNTAHQREVEDLRSAGLNPILSATGGNGASSPVVTAPSVSQAHGNPFSFNNLGKTLQSSAEAKQADAADKQADAAKKLADVRGHNETAVARSQVTKNKADASLAEANKHLVEANVEKTRQQTRTLQDHQRDFKLPFGLTIPGYSMDAAGDLLTDANDAAIDGIDAVVRGAENLMKNSARAVELLRKNKTPNKTDSKNKSKLSDFRKLLRDHGHMMRLNLK